MVCAVMIFNYEIWVEENHQAFTFIHVIKKYISSIAVGLISQYDVLNKGDITKTVNSIWKPHVTMVTTHIFV